MHALLCWEAELAGHLITHPHQVGAVLRQYGRVAAVQGSTAASISAPRGQSGAGQPTTSTAGCATHNMGGAAVQPSSIPAVRCSVQDRQVSTARSAPPAHPERLHHFLHREQRALLRRPVLVVSQAILFGLHHPALRRVRCRAGSAQRKNGCRPGGQACGRAGGRAGKLGAQARSVGMETSWIKDLTLRAKAHKKQALTQVLLVHCLLARRRELLLGASARRLHLHAGGGAREHGVGQGRQAFQQPIAKHRECPQAVFSAPTTPPPHHAPTHTQRREEAGCTVPAHVPAGQRLFKCCCWVASAHVPAVHMCLPARTQHTTPHP